MPVEMLVPLRWRNKGFMYNPNVNGYRPNMLRDINSQPVIDEEKNTEVELSAKVTCLTYDGDPVSYALREVKSYSEIMYPKVAEEEGILINMSRVQHEVQIKVPSGIIYHETSLVG